MLLANRAYVVKKQGCVAGSSTASSSSHAAGQITWSKFDGPSKAWAVAKQRANFI